MSEILRKAVAHHQAGDLNSAERQRVLRSDPEQPDALNLMGVIFLARGDIERALSYAHKAVARRPQEPSFLSNLGNALKAIGRLDEANQAYRDALVRNPRFAAALTNLGVLLIDTDKPGEALGYFRRAIEVDTQLVEAHQGVGDASRIQEVRRRSVGVDALAFRGLNAGLLSLTNELALVWAIMPGTVTRIEPVASFVENAGSSNTIRAATLPSSSCTRLRTSRVDLPNMMYE